MSETPVYIFDTDDLYDFLNSSNPEPIYGIISNPVASNFDLSSKYVKVLTVANNNIKLTQIINYY